MNKNFRESSVSLILYGQYGLKCVWLHLWNARAPDDRSLSPSSLVQVSMVCHQRKLVTDKIIIVRNNPTLSPNSQAFTWDWLPTESIKLMVRQVPCMREISCTVFSLHSSEPKIQTWSNKAAKPTALVSPGGRLCGETSVGHFPLVIGSSFRNACGF